jgi:hypothetical protein
VFSAVVRAIRDELLSLARKATLATTRRRRSKRGVTNGEPERRP